MNVGQKPVSGISQLEIGGIGIAFLSFGSRDI